MSHRLVALNDMLGALADAGPQSSDALAKRLRLNKFDARLMLVDAHAHGLVRTNSRGEWAVSDRGREALALELQETQRLVPVRHERSSVGAALQRMRASGGIAQWIRTLDPRYLARRGLPLAMGAIVCAGGVAVASSRLEGATPPPVVATTKAKHRTHRHRHASTARAVVLSGTRAVHHRRRSTLLATAAPVGHLPGHFIRQTPTRQAQTVQTRCGPRERVAAARGHAAGFSGPGKADPGPRPAGERRSTPERAAPWSLPPARRRPQTQADSCRHPRRCD